VKAVCTILVAVTALAALPRLFDSRAASAPDDALEVVAQRDGVTVMRSRKGPVRFVAKASFAAAPADILRILLDYEHQAGRFPRIAESRILRHVKGQLHVYQRLALPIVSDRDYTLRVEYGGAKKDAWLRYQTDNAAGPRPRDGVVRAPRLSGSWKLDASGDGKETHARFELSMDLGGYLPGALTNRGTESSMFDVVARIRESLQPASAAR